MYQKILLTNDGSELAAAAVPHAATIAKATGAPLVLLQVIDSVVHVMTMMTPSTMEPMSSGEITAGIAEEGVTAQRQEAEQNLAKIREQLLAEGVTNVTAFVAEGQLGDAIVDTAAAQGCDLIIMATHGRSGLGRAVLGSVADHVVRNSHHAVLLVRTQA